MKILYIDCFAGISGDMFVGALLDMGLDFDFLKKELKKLGLKGYSLKKVKESRHHVSGTRFVVEVEKEEHGRNLKDIISLINKSKLSQSIKEKSIHIFKVLGCVEAQAHGVDIDEVHFHEVGAVDSIIDIVSSVIGIESLGIKAVYASEIRLGNGVLKHMPIPAPAVIQLLEGVPLRGVDRDVEMVTPTGAVLLKVFAEKFGPMPKAKIEKTGYGVGSRDDSDLPNALRLYLLDKIYDIDSIYKVETNIDDMNPERYGVLMDELFKNGAVDVYWTSVQMKKNRPGVLVTVLVPLKKLDTVIEIIFKITTTFGVRYYEVERRVLDREIKKTEGKRIKIGTYKGKLYTIKPEYEDWKDLKSSN